MASPRPPSLAPHPRRLLLACVVLVVALLGILRGRDLAEMIKVIALRLLKEERP